MQKHSVNKLLKIAEPLALLLTPVVLILAVMFEFEYTALLSLVVVSLALLPFFSRFEQNRPKPRDIVPIVVMSVIAALGRTLLVIFPNVQPVTAIIIVSGIAFGPQAGFLAGALSALTSNLFLGQGPWTPWQMFAWGMVGYLAGILQQKGLFRKNIAVLIYGLVMSFVFGWIMNIWVVVGFVKPITWETAVLVYITSIYPDILHAISTVVFLILILKPWIKKLDRIKLKYGLFNDPG